MKVDYKELINIRVNELKKFIILGMEIMNLHLKFGSPGFCIVTNFFILILILMTDFLL